MKINQELFNRHFEEYKEWVIAHERFPASTCRDTFTDGVLISSWRINNKDRLVEFEKSQEEFITKILIRDKQLQRDAVKFGETVKGSQGYPWEPKTLQEYLEGDNRYHFFEVDTYIRLIKYANESTEEIHWLQIEKAVLENKLISESFIGNKKKFKKFQEIMSTAINDLNDRQRDILNKRFGLDGSDPMTLDEVANIYDLTGESIRRIERQCLRKLRRYKYWKLYHNLYPIHDTNSNIIRGTDHWFVLWFNHTQTIVKADIADVEQAIDILRLKDSNLHEDYDIEYIKSHTEYGHQIDPSIRMDIDELLQSSANDQIFNYTIVKINQEDRESVEKYVKRYHIDMINKMEEQELLLEHRTKAKKLGEESEKIVTTYQTSMSSNPSMFNMWSQTPMQDIEDQATTLFKNEFPSSLVKIVNSLTIDEDHEWVNTFNKSVRKYFIPTGCCTFAANTLKKCLDAKLHDYTIEVMFSAPSDIDHYLHIKFISDISENIIKVERG